MKLFPLFFSSLLLLALGVSGCSPQDSAKTAAASKREVSLPAIAAEAKGFSAGALMSGTTVYVFFDTQCAHCGHLWNASKPLQRKVKFIWIPIGMINASSKAQGAALLTAANPADLMTEHETSLLSGQGGMAASSSIAPEIEQSIKNNTQLFNSFGADAVPFIVAKNMKSGQTVSQAGAMSTVALAAFLGVDAP